MYNCRNIFGEGGERAYASVYLFVFTHVFTIRFHSNKLIKLTSNHSHYSSTKSTHSFVSTGHEAFTQHWRKTEHLVTATRCHTNILLIPDARIHSNCIYRDITRSPDRFNWMPSIRTRSFPFWWDIFECFVWCAVCAHHWQTHKPHTRLEAIRRFQSEKRSTRTVDTEIKLHRSRKQTKLLAKPSTGQHKNGKPKRSTKMWVA